ncbi:unnamed protein product [Adineta steineri]|uniref:F-box domain-containing protein n=1 Tax=Adineta steineri TaxID=433720 RepID=A0A814J0A3_9BILA|nr:unnamed protein product [Adineta steineri]CAF1068706.1 unnamed protein product [Adineta steineri]
MSEIDSPSTIENFPTELWCEVFQFFDAIELYRIFDDLNSKITSILSESTPLYFKIATTESYDFSSYVILPAVNNRANVKSFKFYEEYQIEEFFTHWPINTFSQLRCLSLVYSGAMMSDCSLVLIEQLSTLPHFERLYIQVGSITQRDQYLKRLLELIFVENDGFHSLKHFVFQSIKNSHMLSLPAIKKRTKLELLTLPSLNRDELVQLLIHIPHIKSIKTNWLYTDFYEPVIITIPALNSTLLNCLHLNVQLDEQWTFEDVEFLLQQVPNVNRLKLTCSIELINGIKWERLLVVKCSKLRILEIVFCSDQWHINPPSIFTELQNTFSTRFWQAQNVQFEHKEEIRRWIVRFNI